MSPGFLLLIGHDPKRVRYEQPPKPQRKGRRPYHCSDCGERGHSSQSCQALP